MRIIGGEARGRPVRLPGGCRIRPTADRVKKSLFDILRSVHGKAFLDLFAGSGNVGLEALSRGARYACFVEKDIRLVEAIRTNLLLCGCAMKAAVIAKDAERGLAEIRQKEKRFDIVFSDPPYEQGFVEKTLQWLGPGDLLTPNGIIVLQHSTREAPKELPIGKISAADERTYGDTVLSFFTMNFEGNVDEEDRSLSGII